MTSRGLGALLVGLLAGCDHLQSFGGDAPPLVTLHVTADGALPGGVQHPRVALMWGVAWLTEPLCILPPDSDAAAAAIAAGCRDPFGFVPARVGATADFDPATNGADLALASLPAADVLVGDVTARVAYGSLVLYDDVDGSGTLELSEPHRLGGRDMRGPPDETPADSPDVVLGASFVSMTAPDRRLAYREGGFATTAFYPRAGCPDPAPAFSIVGAGGFTAAAAIAATLGGSLPQEDPATCFAAPADTPVAIAVVPASDPAGRAAVREVACDERADDGSIRYREPPETMPDLTDRVAACTALASFDPSAPKTPQQWVVSGKPGECKGLTHFVLKGCREDAGCALPDWDLTASPPAWWPCP